MTDQRPANDNDHVALWQHVFPAVLGLVILCGAIRVALAAIF
jgi:hypothetical protein